VPEKKVGQNESKENETKVGFLLIISGASGAGKDTVMAKLLEHPLIKVLNLKKIVTCTDRPPRPGETHGVDYHFVTKERLQEMDRNGELVEEITLTGSSNKATPKSEIERLLNGEDLVWRIDPSRAAEIASEGFFVKHFPEHAHILQKRTTVLCITAPKEDVGSRRKNRDGDKYNPDEYSARDEQEQPHLHILQEKAVIINNREGFLEETVEFAASLTKAHYEKAKQRKN
jgi:guanylate kinase